MSLFELVVIQLLLGTSYLSDSFHSPLPSTASQVPCLLFYIISSYFYSCAPSILYSDPHTSPRILYWPPASVPSVYILFAPVAVLWCLEYCCRVILAVSVLFPCTGTSSGQLQKPSGPCLGHRLSP